MTTTVPSGRRDGVPTKWALLLALAMLAPVMCRAHHVDPDGPSYVPESPQAPAGIRTRGHTENHDVSMTVYPAFPEPGEDGWLRLEVEPKDEATPFRGQVAFRQEEQRTLFGQARVLGAPSALDGVARQDFRLDEEGFYAFTASFTLDGEPFELSVPVRSGQPKPILALMATVSVVAVVLVGVRLLQRRSKPLAGASQVDRAD